MVLGKIGMNKVGLWAFLIGIIGAAVLGLAGGIGLFEVGAWLTAILVLAGLVIGFLNVQDGESVPLMVSALVLGGGAGILATLPVVGTILEAVLTSLATTVIPASLVIAVTTIYNLAR